jgi:hypothetical protein
LLLKLEKLRFWVRNSAMKNKFTLGTRFSLVLSLTIASSLLANAANAETRQERQANEELSRTITKLVDLGTDRQWLVAAALNRATTAQSGRQDNVGPAVDRGIVTAGVPVIRGRLPNTSQQTR